MTIQTIIRNITDVLNQSIGLLMIVGTVVFLWGVVKYIMAAGDEKKVAEGKNFIIYGLIGLFVMIAMWSIVNAVKNTVFNNSGGGSGTSLYSDSESCVQAGHTWNSNTNTCN